MEQETCQVKAADGTEIFFDRTRGPVLDAAVIVCPGFFQSRRTPTFRRLAGVLAQYCSVLVMDFRGHGDSGGLYTFSANEGQDLEAVYRWAQQRYEKIGLIGFSLGAATAINQAVQFGDVRMIVAVSAPSSFNEIELKFWTVRGLQTGLGGLESGAGCRPGSPLLHKERPIDNIQRLSKVPVLLIHGTKDNTILPAHSERLHAAAGEPKRLLLIEGGGHAEELFRRFPGEFLPPVQDWLKTTLLGETLSAGTVRHEEGTLTTETGIPFYYQRWAAVREEIPILLVHDAGDHSGRSVDAAYRLAHNGCSVHALDLPGHGQSPGPRGHIQRFEDYLACLHRFVRHVTEKESGRKPVLLGQGLGGLLCTLYAADHPDCVDRMVLCAPMWGLAQESSLGQQLLTLALSPIFPSMVLRRSQISPDYFSHDPQVVFRYKSDPLVHSCASVRFTAELEKHLEELPRVLERLSVPVLLLLAGEDVVVPLKPAQELFNRIAAGRKRIITYDGYYHDLLNEKDHERVFLDLQQWLSPR